MADYQLTANENIVTRTEDMASIPNDEANRDWVEYQEWLAEGGTPDPYVPPEPSTSVSEGEAIAFDHENRLLALEGQPPITMDEFKTKTRGA